MVIRVLHQSPAPTPTFHLLLSPPVTLRLHAKMKQTEGKRKRGRESEKKHDEGLDDRGEEWERKKKKRRKKERMNERAKEKGKESGERRADGWWWNLVLGAAD